MTDEEFEKKKAALIREITRAQMWAFGVTIWLSVLSVFVIIALVRTL